jgi:hypothetical protein
MITTTLTGHRPVAPHGHAIEDAGVTGPPAGSTYWVDPGTDQVYPLSYRAYRQTREAEEKSPPRHRTLGPDIDHYVWRRGLSPATSEAEVSLTVRPDAPLRIQRLVAEVLRSIRRGQPAGDAIRRVSRRFGLAQTRARAFITASIAFEVRPQHGAITSGSGGQRSTTSIT